LSGKYNKGVVRTKLFLRERKMKRKQIQKRQGDIFFETCSKPKNLLRMKKLTHGVIAYGEVTGHTHKIISPPLSECEVYVNEVGDIFAMSKNSPITVGHDEHDEITMPKNTWVNITRQREYDVISEMRERKVAD
jgi:hypothetical protein